MPGARPSIKPLSAGRSSGLLGSSGSGSFDEVAQLELHLQRQLEEDVARIFDESIYSDLEVVSGKLKILTHSCILKARTHKFFHKLEAILHVNIEHTTFDEIYSFISDAYTECDIQHQEDEIIKYLKEKLILKVEAGQGDCKGKQEDFDESDAYATPNCVSPEESLQKTISSSPSTELTKEYYALVPIEGQILDKELIEQDELSSGFKSFISLRSEFSDDDQITQCIKPTTLSLHSSHISKINKHSIICDTLEDLENSFLFENDNSKVVATSQVRKHVSELNRSFSQPFRKCLSLESGYSPDSLIADEGSSSSEYLSTALSASPAGSHAAQANMNNTFTTVSDSGIDNNAMLESLNSHKDVTLTDVSLSESTLHELLHDEAVSLNSSDALDKTSHKSNDYSQYTLPGTYKPIEMSGRTSTKDEKQRQNEEIVILESSSLSSETGSWESVFPPKMSDTELCEKFLNIERQNCIEPAFKDRAAVKDNEIMLSPCTDDVPNSICYDDAPQPSYKTTCCFIDASSLVDEEERRSEEVKPLSSHPDIVFRSPSRPVPCDCKPKDVMSPTDFSESNENDDSLEQPDPDSFQKDISPTIFEMTLAVDDSIEEEVSACEDNIVPEQNITIPSLTSASKLAKITVPHTVLMTTTPNNSIVSLNASDFKKYDSESSDNDGGSYKRGSTSSVNSTLQIEEKPAPRSHAIRQDILFEDFNKKCNESSPILSGGASIEDHLPKMSHSGSPMMKRKIENIPIVSGAYIMSEENKPEKTVKAQSTAASWVVDMSKCSKTNDSSKHWNNRPGDKACDILKASSKSTSNSESCKSRSSVDSDSSEKSTHKFYIDLASLPDALAPQPSNASESNEKKNIFSMFIDLGENTSTVKEMPARLSSSLNTKKTKVEPKQVVSKVVKSTIKSPNATNGDDAFEKLESLCNSSKMTISEILQHSLVKKIGKEQRELTVEVQEYHRTFPKESIAPTINEEPDPEQAGDIFVRLSDLDRAPSQKDSIIESSQKTECAERMTRSIPDNNWGEMSTSSRSIDIISSFHSENALSLNRLFPHLKNDISRSMPGSLSGPTRSTFRLAVSSSAGEREELVSDVSEMSSVQSSMCRSVVEQSTTEDTSHMSSLLINCQSRLGQDLLRMFMEEIAPDVVVEVSGRRIKAHKCILSSRCQYFAGILSGGWVESAGNVISLPPFSFSVVHFALCHIYSGISTIPDSISIVELATIADMLGLEGLKEAIMFTLKAKYCHHFHEPCQVCTAGVLECFPLCSVYGLDELYRRCLRWITRHFRKERTSCLVSKDEQLMRSRARVERGELGFPVQSRSALKVEEERLLARMSALTHSLPSLGGAPPPATRVWPTKAFATLPTELLDKCYNELLLNLAADNLADIVYDCGCTVASLHRCRWAEVIARLCRRLMSAAAQFASTQLASVLRAVSASQRAAGGAGGAAVDECLARAVQLAAPEQLCRALVLLQPGSKPDLIESAPQSERFASLRRRCEDALIRVAPHALAAPASKDLTQDIRRRLRDAARRHPEQPPPNPPRRPARSPPPAIERVRSTFVPYAQRPPQLKPDRPRPAPTNPPRVRSTKAQEERAKFNMSKSQEKVNGKQRVYENAKPRYLDKNSRTNAGASVRRGARLVSSSESSRTSSPALRPRPRPRTADPRGTREGATPAPDPPIHMNSTNKYATYTKSSRRDTLPLPPLNGSQQPKTQMSTSQNGKARATKIPVFLNQTVPGAKRTPAVVTGKEPRAPRHRGSLMMATKSSSAKVVSKIKEPVATPVKGSKTRTDIPVMERSGTFLKDEPTFGDITTNIHIDE